ncbi:TonB-dependent receptor [Pseudoalteromonas byunsanensis]|uniref:TonB-dependent receptor n=1 Tax=Pseudoalteromonas byunsanensis TaxID=327939 RepID=A0A1S1N0Z4_9GAMM|nr:TonB-dependent receptor [Pseudoalteromonas byunsanensis]OHU94859.1 TonB-dependent receptor [Pseudoalteromonas byunsanensis]
MLANNFKKSLLAVNVGLVLGASVSGMAYAADENQVKEDVEVIEVRGIRRSLEAAINTKRFANSVVDAVSAEDVGKFPDSDVGEALGRISGVSVGRQFGQGQQVSIRGASAQLTRTLLNGHTVASTNWYDQQAIDRSFNYSLMPSEMVGGIDVYKSSQADLPEGGVGGVIIVKSRKPLDLDANTIYGSVKFDYGSVSEAWDPEVSGLYSWKNEDENFGALVALSRKDTEYQRRGTETILSWGGAVAPSVFKQDRERTAANIALQYTPTEELEFGLNYTSLDLQADNINSSLFLFSQGADAARWIPFGDKYSNGGVTENPVDGPLGNMPECQAKNVAGICVKSTLDELAGGSWGQTWVRDAEMNSKTLEVNGKYSGDGFVVDGRIGTTKSEGGTNFTAAQRNGIGVASDFAGLYDASGKEYIVNTAVKSWTHEDFVGDLDLPGWSIRSQPNTDEEDFVQGNVKFFVDFGAITSIKTGFSFAEHTVEEKTFWPNPRVAAENVIAGTPGDLYLDSQLQLGQGFLFPEANYDALLARAKSGLGEWELLRSGYGTIEEENFAAYVMAEFEAEGIRGNFGLRYIKTDAESDFYAVDFDGIAKGQYAAGGALEGYQAYETSLSTEKASYNDVLPSINIVFDLSEDLILRTSAAQVIARPNYANMFARQEQNGYNDDIEGNEVLSKGSPALRPFKATQADLSLEWYYDSSALLSFTYFIKDISNFTTAALVQDQKLGIIDNFGNDNWTLSTQKNATGGKIEGFELQWQNSFDSGFGYVANYTFVDAAAEKENYADLVPEFSDSSKHTVNLVGYYEGDDFTVRAAYNWRSEYMIREGAKFYGNRMHDDYGTLDLSATYTLTDSIGLTLEVVNLLEEDSIQYGAAPTEASVKDELKNNYPAWSFEGERRIIAGVNFRF